MQGDEGCGMTTRFEWGGGADYEGHPFLLQALTHQLRHIPSPPLSSSSLEPSTHPPPSSAPWKLHCVEGFGGGEQEADSSSAPYP